MFLNTKQFFRSVHLDFCVFFEMEYVTGVGV